MLPLQYQYFYRGFPGLDSSVSICLTPYVYVSLSNVYVPRCLK